MLNSIKIKFILLAFIYFISIYFNSFIFGMGGGDSNSEPSIPLPLKNFEVVVQDVQGRKIKANRISWNGKIYLEGKIGETKFTIPFEKMKRIVLDHDKYAPANSVFSEILLRSGEKVDLLLETNSKYFGETSYGKFEVYIRDLLMIEFK